MSTPIPGLKCAVCPQFVSAMQAVEALHVMIVSVMADLSALRRTVLQREDLQELYEQHLRDATSMARPILAEAMECYERMITGEEGCSGFQN